MNKVLGKNFFARPVLEVSQDLIGKYLVCDLGRFVVAKMISEVEAYDGPDDLASHGRFGLTKRNKAMFGEAGIFYIYLNYGVHWMLNVVTGKEGYPSAILIRGVDGVGGPGRVTKFFGIDKSLYGKKAEKLSGLWFEDRGFEKGKIIRTKRIGVGYAGPWANKLYRFVLR